MELKILEILAYTLPSIIISWVAYYFFNTHTKNEDNRRRFLLAKEAQKDSIPLRLQAYERLTLYLERINPTNLLIRVKPLSDDKLMYANLVCMQIEQEFEHNLTQQIYISDECWSIIVTAKNTTMQMIRKAATNDKIENPDQLREFIFNELMVKESPSKLALLYIKDEVRNMW